MKKAKIMLLSVGVLAIVGAALAFKSNKFLHGYCYGDPNQSSGVTCPSFEEEYRISETGAIYYWTTEKAGDPVTSAADCQNLGCSNKDILNFE